MSRGLSERAHQKVLDAATQLFADRGIDSASMDAIAASSGVSKATIYKHWADKDALCMEVLVHLHELDEAPPDFDSGDLKKDIEAFLLHEPNSRQVAIKERLMPHLIAYSARNPEFGRAWRARAMDRARAGLKSLLRRGAARGIFSAVLDEELSVTLLLGPMIFSHIFGPRMDRKWLASGAVESFWKAHARAQPPAANPGSRRSTVRRPRGK